VPPRAVSVAGWGLALASVGFSLVARIVHRGPYYPGFDVVGAANGLFLLSTRSPWAAVREVFYQSRHYSAPFPYFGALSALLPGALTALCPWEYWSHAVTFVLFGVTLGLIGRACRHACLPIHPMHELAPFLDGIRAGRPVDRSVIVGYYVAPQAFDEPVFTREREQMIRAIRQRFTMELESPADAKYVRFRLGADA